MPGSVRPNDFAYQRSVWHFIRPSPMMAAIVGRAAYDNAMREWFAVEPYKEHARRMDIERDAAELSVGG